MHDIDSTRLEFSPEQENEGAGQGNDTPPLMNNGGGAPLSEAEEEALAAELLGVNNEQEMDQFLGGLFKKIVGKIGGAASQLLGKAAGPLAGALKGIASQALPFIGGALGTAIPIPGVGTALGTALGSAASNLLQGELEYLPAEEQEFETARRFVRLASHAINHAARRRLSHNPTAAASLAVRRAIQGWRRPGAYWPGRRSPGYRRWAGYGDWAGNNNWAPPGGYDASAGMGSYDGPSGSPASGDQCPPCPICPPPPPCPVCGDAATAAAAPGSPQPTPGADGSPGAPAATPTTAAGGSEMEFEYPGEMNSDADYYDTHDHSGHSSHHHHHRHKGRWIRHGGKIILFGI